jgi:hypothetical protein
MNFSAVLLQIFWMTYLPTTLGLNTLLRRCLACGPHFMAMKRLYRKGLRVTILKLWYHVSSILLGSGLMIVILRGTYHA